MPIARVGPERSRQIFLSIEDISTVLFLSVILVHPPGLDVGLLVIQLGVGNACLRAVLGMRSSRGDAGSIHSHVSCGESSPSLARVLSEAEDAPLSSSCPRLGPQKHQICGAHQLTSELAGYSRKVGHGSSAAM